MTETQRACVNRWVAEKLADGLERQIDRLAQQADVVCVAVMPDVHQGKSVPNGVVVASRTRIYPEVVGADIGCGYAALRFDARADVLRQPDLKRVLGDLSQVVPTLKQPVARARRLASVVQSLGPLTCDSLEKMAARDGRYQLGTLGRGNHFLEMARDEVGDLWAVVHTGSRAMGQAITKQHCLPHSQDAGPFPSLELESAVGQAYFRDMQWACRYATANRLMILNRLADILEVRFDMGVDEASYLDCPHNFAKCETHGGDPLIVHRKSANWAPAGGRGLIAGSMAVGTVIVVGLGHPESLCSSAHGAGRAMSRTEAVQRIELRQLTGVMSDVIYHQQWASRFRDEAPQAYKDLRVVMRAQHDLVRIERQLKPILNDKRP